MKGFLIWAAAGLGALAIVFAIYSAIAWVLSVLISFITGTDVGFWEALAFMIVVIIIGDLWRAGETSAMVRGGDKDSAL